MKLKLTKKQVEVFEYMKAYFQENDSLPSHLAINARFGLNQSGGHYYQKALAEKGWIEHNAAGKYRFKREGAQA